ncbi:hypothetical protein KAR91_65865, partial [Candidatus Pacearchaeota archaeon]|nr:hypothetical protein [Candidatus Pacearchaeota archaeon]
GSGLSSDNVQDAIDEIVNTGAGQPFTTLSDPATDSIDTAMINTKGGVVITLTAAGNNQTLPTPTDASIQHKFTVINDDSSTDPINIIGAHTVPLEPGKQTQFVYDGDAWAAADSVLLWADDGTYLSPVGTRGIRVDNFSGFGLGAVLPLAVVHIQNSATAAYAAGPGVILNGKLGGTGTDGYVDILFTRDDDLDGANADARWRLSQRTNTEDNDLYLYRSVSSVYTTVMAFDRSTGYIGIGLNNIAPSSLLDLREAGTSGAITDIITLTNTTEAINGGGQDILFRFKASDTNTYDAARILVQATDTWAAAGSSRDSFISLRAVADGSMIEFARIGDKTAVLSGIHVMDARQFSGFIDTSNKWLLGNFGTPSGTAFGFSIPGTVIMSMTTGGDMGVGQLAPSARLDIEKAGVSGSIENIFEITNSTQAIINHGSGILFNLHASDDNPYAAGQIAFIGEGTWSSTAGDRESSCIISTVLNGVLAEKVRILSSGFTGFGVPAPQHQVHILDVLKVSDVGQSSGVVILGDGSTTAANVGIYRANGAGALGGSSWLGVGGFAGLHLTAGNATLGAQNVGLTLLTTGDIGVGTVTPSSRFDIEKAGSVTSTTDLLEITNSGNDASMTATGTGILFNQFYYDAGTPAVADAGRIAVITEGNWTSTVGTQNSFMSLQTVLGGTVGEAMRLTSVNGTVYTPTATQNIVAGTGITAAMLAHIVRVQGSGGAVTVTATPSIADGVDGQVIVIQGDNDTNTLELQDESSLGSSGLQLSGGTNFTLGVGDTLMLMFDAGLDKWVEISRSNN